MTVHDFQACADGGDSGGFCDNYLTDAQVHYAKPDWDKLRFGWLCVNSTDYGNIKTELEEACSLLKCSYEQTKTMNSFFQKVDSLQTQTRGHQ